VTLAPIHAPVQCGSCPREFIPLTAGATRCGACVARRQRIWISIGITAGIVVAAAIAIAVMPLGNKAEAKPPKALIDPPQRPLGPPNPNEVSSVEESVVAGCDPEKIENLVQLYNEEDKHLQAIRAGTAYQKKCKRYSKLDWDILYAHEQLDQWKEAEVIVERLMKEDPSDSDFWWWRGKVRRNLNKHAAAVVDLRQSLSQSTGNSNGIQIDHLDRAATQIDRPCEPAFGLRWLSNIGVELSSSAEREMMELYFDGSCKKLDGTGTLEWSADPLKRTKLAGTIAGKKLNVMIDRNLGTTLVRKSVADTLKLALDDTPPTEVKTPSGVALGTLALADVSAGKAKAPNVPIAIVDELPEGIDAVIGLSFLWRFDVQLDGYDEGEHKIFPSKHE
jgi:hypothetical protein